MRALPCLLVLSGCVTQIYEPGGTPGPQALRCRDQVCQRVVNALEMRRRNIGGWCGTPTAGAYGELIAIGRDAIPYLVVAFDDRDIEVAELAMRASVDLGAVEPIVDWCRGAHDLVRRDMCRRAF